MKINDLLFGNSKDHFLPPRMGGGMGNNQEQHQTHLVEGSHDDDGPSTKRRKANP